MQNSFAVLDFEPMGKAGGKQTNLRLDAQVLARAESHRKSHPLRPSLTQVVEAALREYLDAHEPEAAKPAPPKMKGAK